MCITALFVTVKTWNTPGLLIAGYVWDGVACSTDNAVLQGDLIT